MAEAPPDKPKVAGPLLISALAHVVLLVPLSIPSCSTPEGQAEAPEERNASPPTMTVDLWDDLPPPPPKPPRRGDEICDPNAPPEYHYFDIKPGPAITRIFQAARPHFGEIIMETDSLTGKRSRALRGWFRPFDAVRLLAGDAGLCIFDLHEGVGVNFCRGPDVPFSRAHEARVRQEWKPRDCAEPKPAQMPAPPTA